MLITCPSCASQYTIEEGLVGPDGRRVRCAACREPWFVRPDPAGEPSALSEPDEAEWAAVLAEPAPPPPTAAKRRPARGRRPAKATDGPGLAARWAGRLRVAPAVALAGVTLLLVVSALAGRAAVVRTFPETARLYAALGLPVNLRGGLTFEAVTARIAEEPQGRFLLVEGEIAGGRRPAPVPSLAVTLEDAAGQPVYAWTVDPPRPQVLEGERVAFRARLAAPPPEAREVLVRFAAQGDARAASSGRR